MGNPGLPPFISGLKAGDFQAASVKKTKKQKKYNYVIRCHEKQSENNEPRERLIDAYMTLLQWNRIAKKAKKSFQKRPSQASTASSNSSIMRL